MTRRIQPRAVVAPQTDVITPADLKDPHALFAYYDNLSRERVLSDEESEALESAMYAVERADAGIVPNFRWSDKEDEILRQDYWRGVLPRLTAYKVGRTVDALFARRQLLRRKGLLRSDRDMAA